MNVEDFWPCVFVWTPKKLFEQSLLQIVHFTLSWFLKCRYKFVTSLWQILHSVFGPCSSMWVLRSRLQEVLSKQTSHSNGRSFKWACFMWLAKRLFMVNDRGHKSQNDEKFPWWYKWWLRNVTRLEHLNAHLSIKGPVLFRTFAVDKKRRFFISCHQIALKTYVSCFQAGHASSNDFFSNEKQKIGAWEIVFDKLYIRPSHCDFVGALSITC